MALTTGACEAEIGENSESSRASVWVAVNVSVEVSYVTLEPEDHWGVGAGVGEAVV